MIVLSGYLNNYNSENEPQFTGQNIRNEHYETKMYSKLRVSTTKIHCELAKMKQMKRHFRHFRHEQLCYSLNLKLTSMTKMYSKLRVSTTKIHCKLRKYTANCHKLTKMKRYFRHFRENEACPNM